MKSEQALVDTRILRTLTWLPVLLVIGAVIVLIVNYIPAWIIIAVLEGIFVVAFTLITIAVNISYFKSLHVCAKEKSDATKSQR
jgi:hypothetical protein